MTIGEVAKQAGLRASAIRFYEKSGLLPKPARSSGQRRYDTSILGRLAMLERAKDCGFTLDEARQLFDGDGPISARWRRLAERKIGELNTLEQKIVVMKQLLERRCCCGNFQECGSTILNSKQAPQ